MNVPPINPTWPEVLWRAYLTGDHSELGPMVLGVKRVFGLLLGHRRCRVCNAPFVGPASVVTRMLGFCAGSTLNPTLCVRCGTVGGSRSRCSHRASLRWGSWLGERHERDYRSRRHGKYRSAPCFQGRGGSNSRNRRVLQRRSGG